MKTLEKQFLQQIEAYKALLYKIAKIYMHTHIDQEDLYQEIILQAWHSYPTYRAEAKFSTWLYRVAINTSILHFKKKQRNILDYKDNLHHYQVNQINPNDNFTNQKEVLYVAINQLSPIDKALIFYYLEGYSYQEIAKEMGITEVNTRVKLNRIKNKLKNIIAKI